MEESARPGSAAAASPGCRAPRAPNPAFAPINAWPPVGDESAPRHNRRGTEREGLGRRSGTCCTHRETGQTPPDTPAPSVPRPRPPVRVPELSARRDGPERRDTKRRAKRRPRQTTRQNQAGQNGIIIIIILNTADGPIFFVLGGKKYNPPCVRTPSLLNCAILSLGGSSGEETPRRGIRNPLLGIAEARSQITGWQG